MRITVFFIAIGCAVGLVALADSVQPRTQSILLDPTMPGAFVSVEKIGPREPVSQGEGRMGIWLLLHNNYRFPIEIPTYSIDENGGLGVVYDTDSEESEVPSSAAARNHIDAFGISQLKPGHTLSFSVPIEDIPESGSLRIHFNFVGENRATKGGPAPVHFAVFYGTAVPHRKDGR